MSLPAVSSAVIGRFYASVCDLSSPDNNVVGLSASSRVSHIFVFIVATATVNVAVATVTRSPVTTRLPRTPVY